MQKGVEEPKYTWQVRRLAALYPSVAPDILEQILAECRMKLPEANALMRELFSDVPRVTQQGWEFSGSGPRPSTLMHIPAYWHKYWGRNAHVWPCTMTVAQNMLFDNDESFLYMTEAEGVSEIDYRLSQMFNRRRQRNEDP